MKSTRYSVYCHKIFGKYLLKKYKKKYLNEKNLLLEKANIPLIYEEYISKVYMNFIISFLISLFITLTIYFLYPGNIILLLIPILSVLIPIFIYQFYKFLPNSMAKKRAASIDTFLPYAVNFISTMAVAGVSPVEIFESLSNVDSYGELQIESKKIVKRIKVMGLDNITALKHAIDVTPSKKFKAFLQGILGTLQSGSDLAVYLNNIVDEYMQEDYMSKKKDLELLSVVAELFVISIVAFPLFLVIILSVMGFFEGRNDFTISILYVFSFLVLPLAYIGFYFLIKTTSFEEVKKMKYPKERNLKFYYSENKELFKIIFLISISLLIFYIIVFVIHSYNIIEFNQFLLFDIGFISILIISGPIGFYLHKKALTQNEIHDRLADLFLEISNSLSSGMTIFESIKAAAKGNYGKLSAEIEKMRAELSWKLSINKVFSNFVKRMKSGIIQRVFLTINKGMKMGGESTKIFKAAAKEMKQVNKIEEQKKANMSVYTIVIIMSFFVFLGIILILDKTLFQTFFEASELAIPESPEAARRTLSLGPIDKQMFKYSLFSFVFVQGIGTGALGGYMMDGKLSSGIRYSFILGLVTIIIFKVFV